MKLSLFSIVIRLNRFFGLPAMTSIERKIYKRALLSLSSNKTLNIFEYGSGFSTIYFAKFLKRKKVSFRIYSVDNNSKWHQKIKQLVKKKKLNDVITLYLSEASPFWEKDGWDWAIFPKCGQFAPKAEAEVEYIEAPLATGKKFDFIVIDGRFRRRCLETVTECLAENGIVFLHDAQKTKYHEPLSLYEYSIFIESGKYYPFDQGVWKIWLGSINNPIVCNMS